ncbi:MAG: DUF5655 domain-containing protein [Gemmatimonadota bacterium]|nr:DUF5655 domain-containing protein [Gemmatimonadota bacterium]
MAESTSTADPLFAAKSPAVRDTYDRILDELARIGPFNAEPRKTSIHLVHSVAFAGIHPRGDHLILTLRTDRPIEHSRVHLNEHVSASRWHVEIRLADPADVDAQIVQWLRLAMELV